MKKTIALILCLFLLGAALGAAGCYLAMRAEAPSEAPILLDGGRVTYSTGYLTDLALKVAGLLRSGDYRDLASLIHPDYGLLISPTATVNLDSNRCFTVKEVEKFGKDSQAYIWGLNVDDPSPISMTAKDYFARYVYDRDYTNAPLIGINRAVRTGNSLENVTEAFPGAQFVDLCDPGEREAADWAILRLVFEDHNGELMLTGIIHSEYTI